MIFFATNSLSPLFSSFCVLTSVHRIPHPLPLETLWTSRLFQFKMAANDFEGTFSSFFCERQSMCALLSCLLRSRPQWQRTCYRNMLRSLHSLAPPRKGPVSELKCSVRLFSQTWKHLRWHAQFILSAIIFIAIVHCPFHFSVQIKRETNCLLKPFLGFIMWRHHFAKLSIRT